MDGVFLTVPFLLGTAIAAQGANVAGSFAPPKSIVKPRPVPPSLRHVWIRGYYRWNGRNYTWEHGRWTLPPKGYSEWIPPKWHHYNDGYVLVAGH